MSVQAGLGRALALVALCSATAAIAEICDVARAVKIMKERTTKQFINGSKLRPLHEILEQADRIYRYHWAVVNARLKGAKPPAGLDPGVTLERHHALNWLIGYLDQAWDDVSTDT